MTSSCSLSKPQSSIDILLLVPSLTAIYRSQKLQDLRGLGTTANPGMPQQEQTDPLE